MKIPKNLKHADYVDLIKDIDKRTSRTREKFGELKGFVLILNKKIDNILNKVEDLEKRYCDLVLQS